MGRLTGILDRVARARGMKLVDPATHMVLERSFYIPVPELEDIPDEVWERETGLRGIAFDAGRQIRWAQETLAPWIAEFTVPEGPPGPGRYRRDNRNYEAVDAEILHAILRWSKPKRVIEIGSGWSSLVAAGALTLNRGEGATASYETYDPFIQRTIVPEDLDGLDVQHPLPAQEISPDVVAALQAGDVLLVDSTHCVQIGGDVNHIVLELLPALAPGVLVHFHDIWLPYEYHRALFEHMGFRWNEQYMLQAFLSGNEEWEVLFAAHAVAEQHQAALRELVPAYDGQTYPSCFWMRKAA